MTVGVSDPLWGQTKVSAAEAKEHEDMLLAKRTVSIPSNMKKRFEYSSGNCIYAGAAPKGLAEGTDGWMIQKFTYDGSNQCTDIDIAYGNWTNRASYTYN